MSSKMTRRHHSKIAMLRRRHLRKEAVSARPRSGPDRDRQLEEATSSGASAGNWTTSAPPRSLRHPFTTIIHPFINRRGLTSLCA